MKLLTITLYLSLTILTQATPNRSIKTTTTLLGSTQETYATLTRSTDNQGSYYNSKTTTTLNIYQKTDRKPKLLKSTNILETNTTSFEGPAVTKTITKDKTILLGDLLETYQQTEIYTWPKAHHKSWSSDHHLIAHGLFLNDLQSTKKELFGDAYSKSPITIYKIQEQAGCLYVTVSNGIKSDESNDTQSIIHIPKIKTQQIRDRSQLQPIYLSFGTHQTLKEAQTAASALTKTFKQNKNHHTIEIWSSTLNHKPVYQTILANSTNIIKKRQTKTYETKYNLHLEPISGTSLHQKFPITSPK